MDLNLNENGHIVHLKSIQNVQTDGAFYTPYTNGTHMQTPFELIHYWFEINKSLCNLGLHYEKNVY